MANAHLPLATADRHAARHIGVVHLAATMGAAAGVVFVLCWVGTFISFASPTHAYIALFTDYGTQSLRALIEGGLWAALFGVLSGGLIAALYNLFARLDRH